jgi:hypothetical protein
MSRETLGNGYVRLMADLYDAEAYFARLDALYITGTIRTERGWQHYAERHPWRRQARQARRLFEATWLVLRLLWQVPEKRLRRVYRRRLTNLLRCRPDPSVMRVYAIKCAMHYHAHRLVESLQRHGSALLNTF